MSVRMKEDARGGNARRSTRDSDAAPRAAQRRVPSTRTTQPALAVRWAAGISRLRRDVVLRPVMDQVGPFTMKTTTQPFRALVGSIVHQQVSMSSAAAVMQRLKALCPGGRLSARSVAALSADQLRSAGLSRQKMSYIHDIAARFTRRELTAAKLKRLDDAAAMETLVALRGVGRWTAEMVLLFCLERPDVWPVDDLGLQKALARLYELPATPDRAATEPMGDRWRPWRSIATWYLWKLMEGPREPAIA